jgi:hypothetical protein
MPHVMVMEDLRAVNLAIRVVQALIIIMLIVVAFLFEHFF